jgi:hypothetical protein
MGYWDIQPWHYDDPGQARAGHDLERPSHRLQFAVLVEAMRTIATRPRKKPRRKKGKTKYQYWESVSRWRHKCADADEAYRWLMSESHGGPFEFLSICEDLHLSASRVRDAILNGDWTITHGLNKHKHPYRRKPHGKRT